jgi:hypothetical protein
LYTNSSKSTPVAGKLARATTYYASLEVKNVSNYVWRKTEVNLGTSRPTDRSSSIYSAGWVSAVRPTTMTENEVRPGESAHFEFYIKTPASPVDSKEYFNIVHDGKSWFNDLGMHFIIST